MADTLDRHTEVALRLTEAVLTRGETTDAAVEALAGAMSAIIERGGIPGMWQAARAAHRPPPRKAR